mmetsp:Transcript_21464/g.38455  ORF Transcript_21464/g.38455 Transcript_21464/m.38455 type:complete len:340 (+) Transcript_21464:149-1168(+)|eukprot:CAMPEP_0201608056 /NCGR_PEP_ID=MMETSP0492-20130828/6953_1 /ASSEMBLY_ACC=CAM_ASM_000837 /TAXON_ID=420259 /ORGANISM="Thalassiosira gravida, Strain GMp14c1" /LENGTH=339 /DNA_ID=CAMNT_0048072757 /DNA_START=99 /DNA_END=1118 /DNA_ORIENTATION=+
MSESTNNLKWIGDGSEGGKLDVAEGEGKSADATTNSTITFASATQGTPFNIRLDDDTTASYYEVKVTKMSKEASLGVGLVTADGFQPGWRTKGYFYNGNITNGSAGLIIGFGDRIKEGDVVGVYQKRSNIGEDDNSPKCNIIFYLNGRCLGAGFSVDDSNKKFYPCLHLSGNATVSFTIPPSPTIFEREQKVNSHGDPYSGDWAIEQAFLGPELGELPITDRRSKFKVSFEKVDAPSSASAVQYQLAIKICNRFWTSFTMVGKMEEFDKIEFTGHCASTRMRPSRDCQDMEQLVSSSLSSDGGLKKLIVSESGQLIMSGPTAEFRCSRFIEAFKPVRST